MIRRACVPAALALVLLVGCSGPQARAIHAFDEARYPEALGELRRLEPAAADWSEKRRTRYALYRGLTHLAVGDARAAHRWLRRAKHAWERRPELLDHDERGRLLAAWRSLGLMAGEPG